MKSLRECLPRMWYQSALAASLLPLLPLSWLFAALSALRRRLYRSGLLKGARLPVPVIVVGNITVGGSGKTPLTLALVEALSARGWHPGIISRGHGRKNAGKAQRPVHRDDDPQEVGDEALLLARNSGVPVYIGADRAAAGRALLEAHPQCDLLISDDGLQHYRLCRDFEIALFDVRGAGNGHLLPAGPLREPLSRLSTADAVVWNGLPPVMLVIHIAQRLKPAPRSYQMQLVAQPFVALDDPARSCAAADLAGKKLHALAGIGNPERFFAQLAALGLEFTPRAFPDHHPYCAADLEFARDGILLLTEKDAVKCAGLFPGQAWVLPVRAEPDPDLLEHLSSAIPAIHGGISKT
ncbi:MAG: tetraacyldisaccharide 4'-kinase [Betaproteobacteria bacterium]|nr:tetraacyldisaccharide 4'-kinase [Betaproteobacteria bacterium]